jgi:drug/metabolite transporter (DMT)-like permease
MLVDLSFVARAALTMQVLWEFLQRHLRAIAVIPVLLGIGLMLLTGRTFLLESGAVWFLAVLAVNAGTEALHSVRSKLPRRKRDALVAFLQYGGYSLAAGMMALLAALAFWSSHQPRWLTSLMLFGVLMFLASGFAHKRRTRKTMRSQKATTVV